VSLYVTRLPRRDARSVQTLLNAFDATFTLLSQTPREVFASKTAILRVVSNARAQDLLKNVPNVVPATF